MTLSNTHDFLDGSRASGLLRCFDAGRPIPILAVIAARPGRRGAVVDAGGRDKAAAYGDATDYQRQRSQAWRHQPGRCLCSPTRGTGGAISGAAANRQQRLLATYRGMRRRAENTAGSVGALLWRRVHGGCVPRREPYLFGDYAADRGSGEAVGLVNCQSGKIRHEATASARAEAGVLHEALGGTGT